MVVNTSKENLCINQLICRKKEILFVEKDMIVPDAKPDIVNTISTSGVICIYKTELQDEKIKIDGLINTYIMYLAESADGNVRGINTGLDFSESIKLDNAKEGMEARVISNIKAIDCRVINGRKISLKAAVEFEIQVFSNEEIQIVNSIEDDNDIQILKEDMCVNSFIGAGESKISTKETIPINETDNIAEILKVNLQIVGRDIKISYNKILTKAEAQIKFMYLTEDNKINCVTAKVPLVGFIDIPNVTEGNICNTFYEIKNIVITPNQAEEHSINIDIEVLVKCIAYEEKQINLIQDMYSPFADLNYNKRQINTISNANIKKDKKEIREKIVFSNIENRNLIDVDILPKVENVTKNNELNIIKGDLDCNFTFVDENMQIDERNTKIPFDFSLPSPGQNRDMELDLQIENQDFIVGDNGNIDCNIDMQILSNMRENKNVNIIDTVEVEDFISDQDYSVIVYIVKKGDTLWNIAKRFKTTVDFIVRTNGIKDENKIDIGQKLYIPRFSKISI